MTAATSPAMARDTMRRGSMPVGLDLAWSRLERAASLPTQSLSFHTALAATLLAGSAIAVIATGSGDGIDALLPLCRSTGWLSRWRLAGAREVYEPGDALCRDEVAAAGLAQRLARFRRPIALDRIPADSPLVPALRAALRHRAFTLVRPATPCPTIALDPGWAEPESRFNAGRRSDFRRALRKAEEIGPVEFEFGCPSLADFDHRFAAAIAVEMSGWKREAGTAIGVDPAKQAFFHQYLRSECAAGRLRMAFMRIGGQAVAMQLAVAQGGRLWLYKIGYDEGYRRCSPGTLLMLHVIGQAARAGFVSFELLGNAEPWIAELWTEQTRPCVSLRTYPWNLAGLAALALDGLGWLRARVMR